MGGGYTVVELADLRRRVAWIRLATAAALPSAYLVGMVVGAFLFVADFLLLVCVFDALLLIQMVRASDRRLSAAVSRASGAAPPKAAIDAADERFARFLAADGVVTICGFLFFLLGLDLWVRARLAGADGNPMLFGGVVVALVIIVAGRRGARQSAWRGFGTAHKAVWESPTGLNHGKAAASVDAYMEWRHAADDGGEPLAHRAGR